MLKNDDIDDECRIVAASGESSLIQVVNRPENSNHVVADQVEGDASSPGRVTVQEDKEGLVARWATSHESDRSEWRLVHVE